MRNKNRMLRPGEGGSGFEREKPYAAPMHLWSVIILRKMTLIKISISMNNPITTGSLVYMVACNHFVHANQRPITC